MLIATVICTAGANTKAQTPKTISTRAAATPAMIHLRYLAISGTFLPSAPFLPFSEAFLEPFSRLSSLKSITLARLSESFLDALSDPSAGVLALFFRLSSSSLSVTSAKSSSITCSSACAASKLSLVGTTGRLWRVLATGICAIIAIFEIAGSAVTTTATFLYSLAAFATSFIFTALRSMVAFLGGTKATTFCSAR